MPVTMEIICDWSQWHWCQDQGFSGRGL